MCYSLYGKSHNSERYSIKQIKTRLNKNIFKILDTLLKMSDMLVSDQNTGVGGYISKIPYKLKLQTMRLKIFSLTYNFLCHVKLFTCLDYSDLNLMDGNLFITYFRLELRHVL